MTEDNQKDLFSSQINIKKCIFSILKRDALVKILRIGTQQYSPYIKSQFQTVLSPQTFH